MKRRDTLKALAAMGLVHSSTVSYGQSSQKSADPGGSMSQTTRKIIQVEHITIGSTRSFEDVKAALEALVPLLDPEVMFLLRQGNAEQALAKLKQGPALSIFGSRDHGGLLRIAGLKRKAIQYDIGNPLTASKMTRHYLSAGLYAPIRVLLREDPDGSVAFEYDSPTTLFGQFGDEQVERVARELEEQLRLTLERSAV